MGRGAYPCSGDAAHEPGVGGNRELVTIQINLETAASAGTAPDAPSDAWDRLAALAFDGAVAHGGCSAQAHECTCRAEHAEAAAPGSDDRNEPAESAD